MSCGMCATNTAKEAAAAIGAPQATGGGTTALGIPTPGATGTLASHNLLYADDRMRYTRLANALRCRDNTPPPTRAKLLDAEDGYEDLTYVYRDGDAVVYSEGFVPSCWNALRLQPGYRSLTRAKQAEKIVAERIAVIASMLGLSIDAWTFKGNILEVKLRGL